MTWFFLSLACAFFTATTAMLSKLLLRKKSIIFVGWARFLFSLPIFALLIYFYRPSMHFTPVFWKTVAVLLPFELAAFLLFLKALKISPLSLTFPLLGLTPVFAVLFSYILLRERPSLLGVAGIALVSAGAYLLNLDSIKKGFLAPITAIFKERGSTFMLIVAFIYGITSVLGKKAVMLSGPLSFAAVYYAIFFVLFTPLALAEKKKAPVFGKDIFLFVALGVSFTAAMILHFNAVRLVNVSYMVSVKRLSLAISVLYGALIFKERNIGYRMVGSLVMVGGVLLLGFA